MRVRPDSGCGQPGCQVCRRRQRQDQPRAVTEALKAGWADGFPGRRRAGRGCGHGGMRLAARPGHRPGPVSRRQRAGTVVQDGGGGIPGSSRSLDHSRRGAGRSGDARGRPGLHPATRRGMLLGMATDPMDPATAVTWGPFIQAAYEQFVSAPSEVNPSAIRTCPPATRWCARSR